MSNQLLLIEDIEDLGKKGDVVTVKPGYARNFLLPQQKAVVVDKHTLRMQTRLQEERAKQAVVDKKEAEDFAERISGIQLSIEVKVDAEGHMYGSVTVTDVLHLLEKEGIVLTRRSVLLPQPIKALGAHTLNLRLKEGVPATCTLNVVREMTEEEKEREHQ